MRCHFFYSFTHRKILKSNRSLRLFSLHGKVFSSDHSLNNCFYYNELQKFFKSNSSLATKQLSNSHFLTLL